MNKNEFKRIRQALKITQAACAYALNISHRSVTNYEAGVRKIPGPVAILINLLNSETITLEQLNGIRRANTRTK